MGEFPSAKKLKNPTFSVEFSLVGVGSISNISPCCRENSCTSFRRRRPRLQRLRCWDRVVCRLHRHPLRRCHWCRRRRFQHLQRCFTRNRRVCPVQQLRGFAWIRRRERLGETSSSSLSSPSSPRRHPSPGARILLNASAENAGNAGNEPVRAFASSVVVIVVVVERLDAADAADVASVDSWP